jgi:hypothetical protein
LLLLLWLLSFLLLSGAPTTRFGKDGLGIGGREGRCNEGGNDLAARGVIFL